MANQRTGSTINDANAIGVSNSVVKKEKEETRTKDDVLSGEKPN